VLYDIVKANLEVAVRILGPESRIRPTFVWVPLDIASPQGIAVFASIITMTPGTLSCEVSEDRRWLLVHAFHADDAEAVVADVKSRYEAPLREIFR
jgi:multicomponent K+:H+ antiporter subunit E